MIEKDKVEESSLISPPQKLRQQAEAWLEQRVSSHPERIDGLSQEDIRRLVHELRVHQIELEMQNEELRESQDALEAARTRYFDLYDLAPVGYCTISVQGLIIQANLTAASLLGVNRSALIKLPMTRFIQKDDEDIYYLHRKKLIESGDSRACELRMLKRDGTVIWVHLATTMARDAAGATELRTILTEVTTLKHTENRFRGLMESAPDALVIVDGHGVIVLVNKQTETAFGYSRSELIGKSVEFLIPRRFRETHQVHRRNFTGSLAARQMGGVLDLWALRKDGSEFPVEISLTPLDTDGNKLISASIRDISERRQLNSILQAKNDELTNARVAADKANQAKSEFLSNMSHELRTPLNAILGFAQLIDSATAPLSSSQKVGVDHILKAGWYLLALINEILDLAVVESGKLILTMEAVSLADVIHECEAMIQSQAQLRGISTRYPDIDRSLMVSADHIRLKQVIINLLSNAIKYNRTGGTVAVSCAESAPGRLRISIEDSGAGLTPDQLEQLFQPFNRLGKETGPEEGTGIGLVVSKRIVELMHGTIGVESVVGNGCLFWIELNLAGKSHAHPNDRPTATSPEAKRKPFSISKRAGHA